MSVMSPVFDFLSCLARVPRGASYAPPQLIILICVAVIIIPFWFICKKAGFSPWLSLLNLVPLGNLILLYVLAFAQWKVVPAPQLGYPPPYPQPPLPPQLPPQQ